MTDVVQRALWNNLMQTLWIRHLCSFNVASILFLGPSLHMAFYIHHKCQCTAYHYIFSYYSTTLHHLGPIRHGIQYLSDRNIKVMWLTEVGITTKCEGGIVTFYIVLYDIILKSPWISSLAREMYSEHPSMGFFDKIVNTNPRAEWDLAGDWSQSLFP